MGREITETNQCRQGAGDQNVINFNIGTFWMNFNIDRTFKIFFSFVPLTCNLKNLFIQFILLLFYFLLEVLNYFLDKEYLSTIFKL